MVKFSEDEILVLMKMLARLINEKEEEQKEVAKTDADIINIISAHAESE